jgi:FG-GAP repeat
MGTFLPSREMVVMRRTTFVVLLFLLMAVSVPASVGLAQTAQPAATAAPADVRADFDNDGFSDLAIGAPTESLGASSQAGAVTVLYATASGLTGSGSQLFTQDTPGVPGGVEPGDQFGAALAAGDFRLFPCFRGS